MAQKIRYQYGNFTHESGEVVDHSWREMANNTKRWYRDTSLTEVRLFVELQGCDWAELKQKIEALRDAYAKNDQRFAILDENGQDTIWVLDPNDAAMMRFQVHIVECPHGSMEEIVNIRTFQITLKALREACEDQVIYYEDSVTRTGTCGPQWTTQPTVNLGVRSYAVWPATTQQIVQQGHSIGFKGYYSPDPSRTGGTTPVLGIGFEHLEQRVDRPMKPQRIGPKFYYYTWEWRYVFESTSQLATLPP